MTALAATGANCPFCAVFAMEIEVRAGATHSEHYPQLKGDDLAPRHILLNATGRAPAVPLPFTVATVSSTFTSPGFVGAFGVSSQVSAAWRVAVWLAPPGW